jgi:hypothetical protein
MDSPQRQERRDVRYPLHLPVLIRMAARKELRARSENISLSGILLSSSLLIPEGSAVEISIGVEHMPDPGILLSAHGKVLRVRPRETGDFSVAIQLEGAFRLPLSEARIIPASTKEKPTSSEARRNPAIWSTGMNLVPAWHTET